MNELYLGQIFLFAYDRVPDGFMRCEGQTLKYQYGDSLHALHSLIGNQWGGDPSKQEFKLPDLREKSPIPGLCYMICTGGTYPPFNS